MDERADPRRRILAAAVALIAEVGPKGLTQTRVAEKAGLRQSHLTYYFPKKADLLAAVLKETHRQAEAESLAGAGPEGAAAAMQSLRALMLDRRRMRAFLGIVGEAGDNPETRAILRSHAYSLTEQIAPCFGRSADDPAVIAFIDHLRGVALRLALDPDDADPPTVDPTEVAAMFGLHPVQTPL